MQVQPLCDCEMNFQLPPPVCKYKNCIFINLICTFLKTWYLSVAHVTIVTKQEVNAKHRTKFSACFC